MRRWEAWLLHGGTALVGGTGIVYAVMRYFMTPVDEWSVVNHPLQPLVQHLHVLFAPILVFAVGVVWRSHVLDRWKSGRSAHRGSGLAIALSAAPMVASGYLVQIAVEPAWRTVWVVLHVATSALWILGFAAHQFLSLRRARTATEGPDPTAVSCGGLPHAARSAVPSSRSQTAGTARRRS